MYVYVVVYVVYVDKEERHFVLLPAVGCRVNALVFECGGNFRVCLGEGKKKNAAVRVLEEEEFFGRPRRDDGTKNEEEREEKNLLRVSRDERTARRVRGEIRSGGREMQEISGSTFGVLKEGRV